MITDSNGGSTALPAAPTGVTATRISEGEVYVTWNPVDSITTYLVYYAEEVAGPYYLDGTTNTPSHTSKDWDGYDYGYFKVSAVNAAGEGPQSASAQFGAYTGGGSSGSAPSAPSGVSASASSSSSITVSWTAVSDATGYYVYRSVDSATGMYSYRGTITSTSYTDTGLSQGTDYYYQIAAYNSYGESPGSTASAATQSTTSKPAAPTGVFASAISSSSITVKWTEVLGATKYYVYRSGLTSSVYSLIGTVDAPNTSYTDAGLSPDTTYYYKVSAYNSAGEGPQSTFTNTKTLSSSSSSISGPNAPTGLWAYQTSSSKIYVSWDSVSGATRYNVYWATSASGTWHLDGTTSSTYFDSIGWSASIQT
jgi:hypothetical protein